MMVMTGQDIWSHNKKAIANYVPNGKDLKLIGKQEPRTESIIRMFQSLRDLGIEDSLSFSFGGRVRTFYVLNIPYKNIRQFQERVNALPATPETPPPPFTPYLKIRITRFQAERELAGDNLIRPLELLLMEVEMFWLLILTTAGSRSSRLRVHFSVLWEPRAADRDNSEHRTASLLMALATSTWRTLRIIEWKNWPPTVRSSLSGRVRSQDSTVLAV